MQRLGLDIGSSSIGWALRVDDEIDRKGVITFESGMQRGQGGGYSSPTRDRREARSKRRLIQARRYRKWALLRVLLHEYVPLEKEELETWSKYKKGQVSKFPNNTYFRKWLACDFSYEGGKKYRNPYELRVSGLDKKLTKHEFGRVLYHLVQRRGYKDIGETDRETERQIQRREETGFQKALEANRTIAEALTTEFIGKGVRARNQYPYRDEYEKEFVLICKTQGFDVSKDQVGEYSDEFIRKLRQAIIWQRPLRGQKGNIGKCTLDPSKPRCPISHPVFEIFRTWSFINTIKVVGENTVKEDLSNEERNLVFELFLKKDKNFKFEEIRALLDKHSKHKRQYNYPIDSRTGRYDTSVPGMPICNGLIGVFGGNFKSFISEVPKYTIGNAPKIINGYSLLDLWHILFSFDERTAKNKKFLEKFAVERLGIENVVSKKNGERQYNPFDRLKNRIVKGYSDLSVMALCKIIPFLREGYTYSQAVLLAKVPELLGDKWDSVKEKVKDCVRSSTELYNGRKIVIGITNNLIDQYKGLEHHEKFAYKDYGYTLREDDYSEIEKACVGYFGERTWHGMLDKGSIIEKVKSEYQAFFSDVRRAYRQLPPLSAIFSERLNEHGIELPGKLYHHSKMDNRFGTKVKEGSTGNDVLPAPRIDSIKNPMFNKSMNILRKLINELIRNGYVDEDTEVVLELARELNDNNKRVAIERYQRERQERRNKYREFLVEFKEKENQSINVNASVGLFELWTEQIFTQTEENGRKKVTNIGNESILAEKKALKRYELWMEQKGQCMYTGKMISVTQLFSNEIDLEHTIPRSLLPDNTMANQTVCYAAYNRNIKKGRLPFYCPNYSKEKAGIGTAILSRLDDWVRMRDNYKNLYEERMRPRGAEDESRRNRRIQEKHYFRMHYDYWKEKVERFMVQEVKDGWARRQLVDTQMVSKYSREFLKTYFRKVAVQKGSVTAEFRRIFGFQEQDEAKSRVKHTHHAIDAAVLTLIPTNSSHRQRLLREYYEAVENFQEIEIRWPFKQGDAKQLMHAIENDTLVVNYGHDRVLKQTFGNVRRRGKLQYLKDKNGIFVLDREEKKILLKKRGDTIRGELFAQTYVGKIRNVERQEDGRPKKDGVDWKYKKGKDEFLFVKREGIDKIKQSDKLIDSIVDPIIRGLVLNQRECTVVKDYQGNVIRHVRIKTNAGREVKDRVNYLSRHNYKNKFYSAAGSLPYAVLLQRGTKGSVDREMIPIASFEIAEMYRRYRKFDVEAYVKQFHKKHVGFPDKKLLRKGQRVIVLKGDAEYEKVHEFDFQQRRLYVIIQFSEGNIWLKHHLEARSKEEIKADTKIVKDRILRKHELLADIPEVGEDPTIQDYKRRRDDYENRRYKFGTISTSFRLRRLADKIGVANTKVIKRSLDKVKAISGSIEIEGETPLLKMSKSNWNYLIEGYDFEVSLLGQLTLV